MTRNSLVTWPMPLTEKEFPLYALTVNATPVPVWTARVREEIHKPQGAGWTHMLNGRTEWCGFARFDFAGEADVAVTVARDFSRADILPRSAGIAAEVEGRVIRFRMPSPRPLTLVLDGQDAEPLHLFAHRPETDIPSPDDPNVVYFGPGEHWVDTIKVRSGQTVYLHGAAIVRASLPAGAKGRQGGVLNLFFYGGPVIDVTDAQDVRICGRGILDGTLLPHPARNLMRLSRSQRVRVEGVTLRNSPNWHLPIAECDDVTVEGLCGISGRLNSDGINCVSSSNIRVRDCFMRSHDDTFVVKTIHPTRPAENILYERCVAWNDWGYAFGVSYETRADIRNVRFLDCDAVYARHWPLGIHVADSGTVENITFERMTVEYPRTGIAREMSRALVKIDNQKDVWATEPGVGRVRHIVCRNIDVRGVDVPAMDLHGCDADHPIEDLRFSAVTVNGEPLTASHPLVRTNAHVHGVAFDSGPAAAPLRTPARVSGTRADVKLTGDWRLQVSAKAPDGRDVAVELDAAPPEVVTVASERHERLPDFNPKSWSGWGKGVTLNGVRAQECSAKGALDPASLQVRAANGDGGVCFERGTDYEADLEWGSVGRLPGGRIAADQAVSISYRYALLRIDSVMLGADGAVSLRRGRPDVALPRPPEPGAGETPLANVFVEGLLARLDPEHLFPVIEFAYPEPRKPSPTIAESLLPKAMAKLTGGGTLRILAWGDSVTDGGYLPNRETDRWQAQFVERLRRRFPAATIELTSEAWGGRNTASYLAEPPGALHNYREKVLAPTPDLIVSEFVNDAGLSPQQVEERYGRLLADFQSIGAEWIILTPHYVRPDWMGLSRQRDIDDDPRPYVKGLREFAAKHRIALADASLRWGRLWRQGIPYGALLHNTINHPDVRGMKLFADSLMELFP